LRRVIATDLPAAIALPLGGCIYVAMNAGPDPEPDPSNPEVSELDTGALQDSQDAIDRGREAAREALKDEADQTAGARDERPTGTADSGGPSEKEPKD
jgi:hypothetical protein